MLLLYVVYYTVLFIVILKCTFSTHHKMSLLSVTFMLAAASHVSCVLCLLITPCSLVPVCSCCSVWQRVVQACSLEQQATPYSLGVSQARPSWFM